MKDKADENWYLFEKQCAIWAPMHFFIIHQQNTDMEYPLEFLVNFVWAA